MNSFPSPLWKEFLPFPTREEIFPFSTLEGMFFPSPLALGKEFYPLPQWGLRKLCAGKVKLELFQIADRRRIRN
jgi:hypothetical protein